MSTAAASVVTGSARGQERNANRVRVVYIAGCGRSGSTFLDLLLGNHPGAVSVGELAKHISNGWSAGRLCSCGKPSETCEYWAEVRRLWIDRVGNDAAAVYPQLEHRFSRVRSWPALLRSSHRASRAFHAYVGATHALYESVAQTSGRWVVIDSSKLPIRAFALSLMRDMDLRVIHLVRDPRGVAWSHIRRSRERAGASGLLTTVRVVTEWLSRNLQTSRIRRSLPADRTLLLRYEDLVMEPSSVLERIGILVDCDMTDVAAALQAGRALKVGHVAAGNRLRLDSSLKLRPDVEWMANLSARDARIVRMLCVVALRRYGYPV